MKNTLHLSVLFLLMLSGYAQNKAADEQELTKLSKDWMEATMKRDEKTLNKIVAPEFKLRGTDLENPGITREVWMKNTMENLKIDAINYNKIKVVIVGNVAIVQSELYWSVSFRDSPANKDTVNLVDTWLKRDQGWQVVSRIVVDK